MTHYRDRLNAGEFEKISDQSDQQEEKEKEKVRSSKAKPQKAHKKRPTNG